MGLCEAGTAHAFTVLLRTPSDRLGSGPPQNRLVQQSTGDADICGPHYEILQQLLRRVELTRLLHFSYSSRYLEDGMLWTIFVILLVLWLLGLVSGYTLGGFIHVLLVIAIVVLIIQLISGRRAL